MSNKDQGVELFIYDNKDKVLHVGFCRIFINTVIRVLIVKYNGGKNTLKASFNLQFVIQNNILCMFASDSSKDFILSFINPSTCKRVYDIVTEGKIKESIDDTHGLIKERFVSRIVETIESCKSRAPRLKTLLADFIHSLSEVEKQQYLEFFRQNNVEIQEVVKNEVTVQRNDRKSSDTANEQLGNTKKSAAVINRKRKQPSKETNSNGSKAEKNNKKQIIVPDEKVVKKPFFELHEKTDINDKIKKLLVIFNPKNKKQCYEYYWENKNQYFLCCGCANIRKTCVARYHEDEKNGDFITFGKAPHVCEWREYDISRFFKDRQRILPPNFIIQEELKNGIERKVLIIFSENDKTKCYKLYYTPKSKAYSCLECKKLRRAVTARIHDNPEGASNNIGQYVIPGKNEHICRLQEYSSVAEKKEKIVEHSGFEIIENKIGGPTKIILFDQENRQLCYEFTQEKSSNNYFCLGCIEKENRKFGKKAYVQLCKRQNGEHFLILKKWDHHCKIRSYQAQKFQVLKPPNECMFYREKSEIRLAVFCSEKKDKCYIYQYLQSRLKFVCKLCQNINTVAKLCQDDNGKEYLILGLIEHNCKAIPYSSITKNKNIKILETSGLPPQQLPRPGKRPHPSKVEADRILNAANFELQWSKYGKPNGKLIIFCPENKKLCYELGLEYNNSYRCNRCKAKGEGNVIAKLYYNDNQQPYLILGEKKHICDLVEYLPDKGILKPSDYQIIEFDENQNPIKLIVFTNPEKKKKCYTYSHWSQENVFRCRGCMRASTNVNAKFYKDKDGNNCLKLSQMNHVCEPEDYVPQGKEILPASRFVLMPSKNGTIDAKLFIFDGNDSFNGYWFNICKTVYYCAVCRKERNLVKAKVCEKKDGEKYLELYHHQKHVCKSINLQKEKRIIKAENFKIVTNSDGTKMLEVKTSSSEAKWDSLIFDFDDGMKTFCCRKCKSKGIFHAATICLNNENEEFLIINGNFKC